MARRPFGGTTADVATDIAGDRVVGASLTVWTAATGGTQLTDLQTPAGVAIAAGVVTSDANGIVAFLGPTDGTATVYVDGGLGGRTLMSSTDLASRVGSLEAGTGVVSSVNTRTGAVTLAKADVGLGSVDNTADSAKPVSTVQQTALNLKADLASPALTGSPTAPTQTAGDSSTKLATTAFVEQRAGTLLASADLLRKTAAGLRDPNRYVHPNPPTIATAGNQTSSAFTAGTFLDLLANTAAQANVEFSNGVPTVINASSTDFVANRVHSGPDSPFRFTVETDADVVEVYVRLVSATGAFYRLLVDGQHIGSTTETNLTGTNGTVSRITLTFATAEPRTIEMELHLLQYRTVRALKTRDLWKPTRPRPLTTLVYGDSVSYGTGATSSLSAWPYTFGRASGLGRNIIVNAEGGTGYLNAGSAQVFYDRIAVNATQSLRPNLIVMAGGLNDSANNGYTSVALTAEVRRCLQLIATTWPTAKVILMGSFFPNLATDSTVRNNITAANTAVLAAATEPNVIGSINMSAWITDDNDDTYIGGDGTHPTQAGHDFYGQRIAGSVRSILDTAAAA